MAQTQPPPPVQSQPAQTTQILSPDQLDDLVAPIALYPDPLLGQVLAASTYPLEVVEAQQWLQQNSNLHGSQLMDAARQQNWDASVQALVAFPTVLTMLNRDVRWTTDLGNAFLAQQEDVMHAVQRMRVRAQQKGRLSSTAQQTVTTETQGGQQAVVIEPADPQVVYVPVYNPEYVWGPPAWGYYPPLWYPSIGYGFGFGPGIFLGGYFPSWGGFGWGGWGSAWGWGCGWFGGGLYVNNFFFNHYGFHNYYGGYGGYRGGFGGRFAGVGRGAWQHDPYHRAGIAYGNRGVASRFNNQRFAAGRFSRGFSGTRGYAGGGSRGFNGGGSSGRGFAGNRAGSSGYSGSGRTQAGQGYSRGNYAGQSYNRGNYSSPGYGRSNPSQGYRGFSGANAGGGSRGYSAPRSYSTPRSYSGGGRSFSGGGFSSGRSFGGGGRSFGGGGRSFGGGGRSFGGGGGGHSFGGGGHGGGGGHAGGGGHGGGRR